MNYYILVSALFLLITLPEGESICVTRRTDWGQFGSFFTDPLCDVWCRIRRCGKGVCRDDPSTSNTANCVCEKCYRDGDGNVIFPERDGFEQTRLNFDTSSPSSSSGRNQDDLYPSQNSYPDWN